MDFSLVLSRGLPQMLWQKADPLYNNVALSLLIVQGSFFAAPTFGLRDRGRLKNTERTARLREQDCRAALQWLLDAGRAVKVEVTAERDRTVILDRLKIRVRVTAPDGRPVEFERFEEVV
jgi:phage gp46-like protein